jgi:hypothetical protein
MYYLADFTLAEWVGGLAIALIVPLAIAFVVGAIRQGIHGQRITANEARIKNVEDDQEAAAKSRTELLLGQAQIQTDLGYIKGALPDLNDGSGSNPSQA